MDFLQPDTGAADFEKPRSATHVAAAGSDNNQTTYTLTGVSFGAAAADRKIIVAVAGNSPGGSPISSVTIGGIAATLINSQVVGVGVACFAIADVPTGTSGTVVVTFGEAGNRCTIDVWQLIGLDTSAPAYTAFDATHPLALTIPTVYGGFVLALAFATTSSGGVVWSGATERSDRVQDNQQTSAADAISTGAPISLSATVTDGTNYRGLIAVSF